MSAPAGGDGGVVLASLGGGDLQPRRLVVVAAGQQPHLRLEPPVPAGRGTAGAGAVPLSLALVPQDAIAAVPGTDPYTVVTAISDYSGGVGAGRLVLGLRARGGGGGGGAPDEHELVLCVGDEVLRQRKGAAGGLDAAENALILARSVVQTWRVPAPLLPPPPPPAAAAAGPASGQTAAAAGLQNLGNTCYMNAALVALLHTPAFARVMADKALAPALAALYSAPPALVDDRAPYARLLAAKAPLRAGSAAAAAAAGGGGAAAAKLAESAAAIGDRAQAAVNARAVDFAGLMRLAESGAAAAAAAAAAVSSAAAAPDAMLASPVAAAAAPAAAAGRAPAPPPTSPSAASAPAQWTAALVAALAAALPGSQLARPPPSACAALVAAAEAEGLLRSAAVPLVGVLSAAAQADLVTSRARTLLFQRFALLSAPHTLLGLPTAHAARSRRVVANPTKSVCRAMQKLALRLLSKTCINKHMLDKFKLAIAYADATFAGYRQQDAHELLVGVFTAVVEETACAGEALATLNALWASDGVDVIEGAALVDWLQAVDEAATARVGDDGGGGGGGGGAVGGSAKRRRLVVDSGGGSSSAGAGGAPPPLPPLPAVVHASVLAPPAAALPPASHIPGLLSAEAALVSRAAARLLQLRAQAAATGRRALPTVRICDMGLRASLRCVRCNVFRYREEVFHDLSLDLPSDATYTAYITWLRRMHARACAAAGGGGGGGGGGGSTRAVAAASASSASAGAEPPSLFEPALLFHRRSDSPDDDPLRIEAAIAALYAPRPDMPAASSLDAWYDGIFSGTAAGIPTGLPAAAAMDAAALERAYATEHRVPAAGLSTPGKPPSAAGVGGVSTDMFALSLLGLLRFFFREQVLELRCESAGCDATAAIAQYHISQLPRTLILHLKRFEMELIQRPAATRTTTGAASAAAAPAAVLRPLKRRNTVFFPPTLSLAPFCTPVVRLPPPLDLRARADVDADLRNATNTTGSSSSSSSSGGGALPAATAPSSKLPISSSFTSAATRTAAAALPSPPPIPTSSSFLPTYVRSEQLPAWVAPPRLQLPLPGGGGGSSLAPAATAAAAAAAAAAATASSPASVPRNAPPPGVVVIDDDASPVLAAPAQAAAVAPAAGGRAAAPPVAAAAPTFSNGRGFSGGIDTAQQSAAFERLLSRMLDPRASGGQFPLLRQGGSYAVVPNAPMPPMRATGGQPPPPLAPAASTQAAASDDASDEEQQQLLPPVAAGAVAGAAPSPAAAASPSPSSPSSSSASPPVVAVLAQPRDAEALPPVAEPSPCSGVPDVCCLPALLPHTAATYDLHCVLRHEGNSALQGHYTADVVDGALGADATYVTPRGPPAAAWARAVHAKYSRAVTPEAAAEAAGPSATPPPPPHDGPAHAAWRRFNDAHVSSKSWAEVSSDKAACYCLLYTLREGS